MNNALVATIQHTRNQTLKLVNDLSEAQMTRQPAPQTNHAAWVLGHLLGVDCGVLNFLGGQAPQLEPNWKEIYGGGSTPTAEATRYKSKLFYLERMADVHTQILARIKALRAEDLNKPHPDPNRRARFPTLGHHLLFYCVWHETYHAGQLSAWRRVQGWPAV